MGWKKSDKWNEKSILKWWLLSIKNNSLCCSRTWTYKFLLLFNSLLLLEVYVGTYKTLSLFSFQKCVYDFLVFITAVCFLFLLELINKLKSLKHCYFRKKNNSHRPIANISRLNIYFCCWLFLLPGRWINTTNSYLLCAGSDCTVKVTKFSVNWPWPATVADNEFSLKNIGCI